MWSSTPPVVSSRTTRLEQLSFWGGCIKRVYSCELPSVACPWLSWCSTGIVAPGILGQYSWQVLELVKFQGQNAQMDLIRVVLKSANGFEIGCVTLPGNCRQVYSHLYSIKILLPVGYGPTGHIQNRFRSLSLFGLKFYGQARFHKKGKRNTHQFSTRRLTYINVSHVTLLVF